MDTDKPRDKRTTLRRVQIAGSVIGTAVECYVLMEILWYYTKDESLREALSDKWEAVKSRAEEHARVRKVLNMIRDLPETE
jgi:hypothetical protein